MYSIGVVSIEKSTDNSIMFLRNKKVFDKTSNLSFNHVILVISSRKTCRKVIGVVSHDQTFYQIVFKKYIHQNFRIYSKIFVMFYKQQIFSKMFDRVNEVGYMTTVIHSSR